MSIDRIDREASIRLLVDHYEHPRNREPMPEADIQVTGGDPGCGHEFTMYARVTPDGYINRVTFEGEGCTIAIAAASYLTDVVCGMSLAGVDELPFDTLIEALGREVVLTRPLCATLALGTLKQGVHEFRMRRAREQAE